MLGHILYIMVSGNFENSVREVLRRGDVPHIFPANTKEMISTAEQLPTPSGGFHQLEDGVTYILDGTITSSNGLRHRGTSMVRGINI